MVWIKAIREALGLSASQLGKRAGIDQSRISRLENAEKDGDIYYHQGTRECDFLTVDAGRVMGAFQVCKSVSAPATKEREMRGLMEAMEAHKVKTGYILTEDENEDMSVKAGKVLIQPLWYRLLTDS